MAEVEDWEADDFEPDVAAGGSKGGGPAVVKGLPPTLTDKWDGEDEDASVRENWEEDSGEEKEASTDGSAAPCTVPKKKRPLKEIIAEKEERTRKEQDEKRIKEEELKKAMTPQERHAEKLRQQKIQEEADLALAIEAFGIGKEDQKGGGGGRGAEGAIDSFEPSTKEEFDKFADLLCGKIAKYEKSALYDSFVESFCQKLALGLEADVMKKISISLSALSSEKSKLKGGTKGGKKKNQKASLVVGKDTEAIKDDGGATYDDFDDYL